MTRTSPARLLSLPLLGALALTTTAADAGPSTRSVDSPAPGAAKASPAVSSLPIFPMVSKQSIYLPCYAFVPVGGPRGDWTPSRSSCYLMAKNKQIGLAVPLHFPVTSTQARVTKLRCWLGDANGTDEVALDAYVRRGAVDAAELHVVQKSNDEKVEHVGTVNHAYDHDVIDAATHHYDLAVSWEVKVPDGKGWMPQSNLFHGCRVDYVVDNLP